MSDDASQSPADHSSPTAAKHRRLRRLLQLRVWFTERVRPTEMQATLFWAGLVGFGGAITSILFRMGASGVHRLLTGQPGSAGEDFSHLPLWLRLVAPTMGGVLAGAAILFGGRLGRSVNTTDYMEAIVLGGGVISFRSSLVKCTSAMFTIASGGSIGREGPLVQLSALLASLIGRWREWPAPRRRLLVACGAAAGIASAYNAPIAGALFVAEVVIGSVGMESFGPLVFASVVATLTSRRLIGGDALYYMPAFRLNSDWEVLPYAALGLLTGLIAPWFLRLLRASEAGFSQLKIPVVARLALGGAIVGGLAIVRPEVCGNGYAAITEILHGKWLWGAVLVVFVCKIVATSATFGSGAVGGVFTPTLFVGASLGYLFGIGGQALFPNLHLSPSAFALVGMGAFLAGTTHAPLMAIILLFEVTLDYAIILPLMLACVISHFTSISFEERSIYSESLQRKGANFFSAQLAALRSGDLMKGDPGAVALNARFEEIAHYFITHRFNYLYVIDQVGRFMGAVALHDVKSVLNQPEMAAVVIASDILREDFPTLYPETPLDQALDVFARHDSERLPVVDHSTGKLLGRLSKTDLILALAARPQTRAA